jgi:hypothetical protein
MEDILLTENTLDEVSHWSNPIEDVSILLDPTCTDLFDQNGYHLTKVEQAFAEVNGYPLVNRRHETVLRQDWLLWNKYERAHINHSDIFERKGYEGEALEQLKFFAIKNPMLYKIIKMKPKWGIDISIDYVSKDDVIEVFHYEWDSFNYKDVVEKKAEIQDFILTKDWDKEAEKLLEIKTQWINLPFFEQTKWRTNYFNISPENFKNVIWESNTIY